MIRSAFLIIICSFLFCNVEAKERDSTIFYFRQVGPNLWKVTYKDPFDYIRIVYSPEAGDTLGTIKEFYKNGSIHMLGKFDPKVNYVIDDASIKFSGDLVTFYPTGKRQTVVHYNNNGLREGYEYVFYPDGRILWVYKISIIVAVSDSYDIRYWECYDKNGNKICSDGNGEWLLYDNDFKNVIEKGEVKHGHREGKWFGYDNDRDSVKYMLLFHKNHLESSVGYDKFGKPHSYEATLVSPKYEGGDFTFYRRLKKYLKLSNSTTERKLSVGDTLKVSFIIEKDGRISDFKILKDVEPGTKDALTKLINNDKVWQPAIYYGMITRTRMTLLLSVISNRLIIYNDDSIVDSTLEFLGF